MTTRTLKWLLSGTPFRTVLPYLNIMRSGIPAFREIMQLTQMMMFQSERVADAGYETNWVENVYWRRSLQLLIMRAQKPLKLTGGPFYVISYDTLLAVSNISIHLCYDNVQTHRWLPTNRRMK